MQFKNVVGQEEIKSHLIQMAKEEKVPHAQLFLSQPGAGGLALALAFSQYIVCENKGATDSCGSCPSCQRASKIIHPDIYFTFPVIKKEGDKSPPVSRSFMPLWRDALLKNMDAYMSEFEWIKSITNENKQGNITADEAREIIHRLNLKAFEGGKKIQIIWMAEALGLTGNILLKLIEEPPSDTIIILVAENPEELLTTILSRTQIVRIPPLEREDIAKALVENFQLEPAEADELAFISGGNYRKAQQLAKGEEERFNAELLQWMVCTMRGPANDLLKWTDISHTKGREYLKKFLEYTVHIYRETLAGKYTDDQMLPRVTSSEQTVVKALKKYITYDKLYELIPLIEERAYHIERNASAKIVLLDLSIQMRKILQRP
jgi:DNA polymerase-3 subunit delta'